MRFSDIEISELSKAWLVISLAFAIAWRGVFQEPFWVTYLMAALTVGVAFLLHEIAHKLVAQKYGCWAEFRSFNTGLLLAVLMSFVGFVFAAPGAVMISGIVTRDENGKIAAAGPLVNIVIAVVAFLVISFGKGILIAILPGNVVGIVYDALQIILSVNSWLALFNLIPFGPLDGVKIMSWSQPVWLAMVAFSGYLVFFL